MREYTVQLLSTASWCIYEANSSTNKSVPSTIPSYLASSNSTEAKAQITLPTVTEPALTALVIKLTANQNGPGSQLKRFLQTEVKPLKRNSAATETWHRTTSTLWSNNSQQVTPHKMMNYLHRVTTARTPYTQTQHYIHVDSAWLCKYPSQICRSCSEFQRFNYLYKNLLYNI